MINVLYLFVKLKEKLLTIKFKPIQQPNNQKSNTNKIKIRTNCSSINLVSKRNMNQTAENLLESLLQDGRVLFSGQANFMEAFVLAAGYIVLTKEEFILRLWREHRRLWYVVKKEGQPEISLSLIPFHRQTIPEQKQIYTDFIDRTIQDRYMLTTLPRNLRTITVSIRTQNGF